MEPKQNQQDPMQLYVRKCNGKQIRYLPYQPDTIDVQISTDKHKAMTLNIAIAAMDSVMQSEKPKSARYTRLSRAIDQVLVLIDDYRINAWPAADICKAAELVDRFNLQIDQVFGERVAV